MSTVAHKNHTMLTSNSMKISLGPKHAEESEFTEEKADSRALAYIHMGRSAGREQESYVSTKYLRRT